MLSVLVSDKDCVRLDIDKVIKKDGDTELKDVGQGTITTGL